MQRKPFPMAYNVHQEGQPGDRRIHLTQPEASSYGHHSEKQRKREAARDIQRL